MESYGIPAGGPSLLEVGNYLRTAATTRWLFPEELLVLLSYSPYEFGLILNHAAPSDPQSGQLFLFGDSLNCKQDGVSWAK